MSSDDRAAARPALLVFFFLMMSVAMLLVAPSEHPLVYGDIVQKQTHGVLEGHYQARCVQRPDDTTWRCERG